MTKMSKILSSYKGKGVTKAHLQHQIDKAKEKLEGKTTLNNYTGSKAVKFTGAGEDMVNHPAHYTQGNIECIDAITEATKFLRGIEAVDTANILKYVWRWNNKNGLEDLRKARWYLNHLISHLEENQS